MRILHTSDWHLGQTFYEYERYAEHQRFLDWLQQTIAEEHVDVLLIAGDLFDNPNPSAESQRLYYSFLRQVTTANPDLQIVIIAGNHDSAARLEAPNPLLEEMNISVRGVIHRHADGSIDTTRFIVPLYAADRKTIEAYCLAIPYLRFSDFPQSADYAQCVEAVYRQAYAQVATTGKPVIAMGHLQATGATLSEGDRSERTTLIGGIEGIPPAAFDKGIAYVALGHLHRQQQVAGRDTIRYSGTPLPMSFAEKNNHCSVLLADCLAGSETVVRRLEVPGRVRLLSLPAAPAPLPEVLCAIASLPDGTPTDRSPYLELNLLMTEPDPSYRYKLETALAGKAVRLARITANMPAHTTGGLRAATYEELQHIRPLDVALDYYKRTYDGQDMPPVMKQLFETILKETEA